MALMLFLGTPTSWHVDSRPAPASYRQVGAQSVGRDAIPIAGARTSPQHVVLFAPPAHRDAYRAFELPLELDAALAVLSEEPTLLRPPGSWSAGAVHPLDAFGQGGIYDRWKLLRLYGARRARVARGPRQGRDQTLESWTLISPYPDVTFTRLVEGTLLLVLRVP